MIIQQLIVSNFGIYGGEYTFDLVPSSHGSFSQPIILLTGKNGVGKTTFVEAIRLCLHGSLAIGSRVSRADYYHYLESRIHRPIGQSHKPTTSRIELLIEYVDVGHRISYLIRRAWSLLGGKLTESLLIEENGTPLSDLTPEEKEGFLRELIAPSATDLFFFDGEKLRTLAEDVTSGILLSETIRSVLGLHLVEQLQRDLNIYIARQEDDNSTDLLLEKAELNACIDQLTRDREKLVEDEQPTNAKTLHRVRDRITRQEQKIASEGGLFADTRKHLITEQQQNLLQIAALRRYIQELCSGLFPFSIVPQLTQSLASRLQGEEAYEQWSASKRVLDRQFQKVSSALDTDEFWATLGIKKTNQRKEKTLAYLADLITQLPDGPADDLQIIHGVSGRERDTLMDWISLSLDDIPRQFCETTNLLTTLERRSREIEVELSQIPAEESLRPLVEELSSLHRELAQLEREQEQIIERVRQLEYNIAQLNAKSKQIDAKLAETQKENKSLQLAIKSQTALQRYEEQLIREKLSLLERGIVDRLRELSRKDALVQAVQIDPASFNVTLFRHSESFDRSQLSAGEKQLLAIATMWALREISGLPMPVIVDTPLGRLDTDHRLSMVQNYFPRAGHQVILLATDAEIDDQLLLELEPAISHTYCLEFDAAVGSTTVERKAGATDAHPPANEKVIE